MSLNSVMSKCRHEGWITEEHYKEYIELVKLQESSEAQRKFLADRVDELEKELAIEKINTEDEFSNIMSQLDCYKRSLKTEKDKNIKLDLINQIQFEQGYCIGLMECEQRLEKERTMTHYWHDMYISQSESFNKHIKEISK